MSGLIFIVVVAYWGLSYLRAGRRGDKHQELITWIGLCTALVLWSLDG